MKIFVHIAFLTHQVLNLQMKTTNKPQNSIRKKMFPMPDTYNQKHTRYGKKN